MNQLLFCFLEIKIRQEFSTLNKKNDIFFQRGFFKPCFYALRGPGREKMIKYLQIPAGCSRGLDGFPGRFYEGRSH
jgi:hypothetical protein